MRLCIAGDGGQLLDGHVCGLCLCRKVVLHDRLLVRLARSVGAKRNDVEGGDPVAGTGRGLFGVVRIALNGLHVDDLAEGPIRHLDWLHGDILIDFQMLAIRLAIGSARNPFDVVTE